LIGGGDDRAFLWKFDPDNRSSLVKKLELSGHTDSVTSVGFNFNGSLLLTGSYDGTVRIWDVETGSVMQILDGPEDVEWAYWHNKGNAIIAGSKDGTVWMWLAHNGQCMQVFAGHEGWVSCGSFSVCGKFVCTAGEDGTVRVWLPKTGACKHVFDGVNGHKSSVTCLAVGEDMILTGMFIYFLHYCQID
jgi:angio-associated migratory cell protein